MPATSPAGERSPTSPRSILRQPESSSVHGPATRSPRTRTGSPTPTPGGHRNDLDWATTVLAEQGIALTSPPVQVRTWNLSSIWRLPTAVGSVWLKVTPPFCASEAAIMPLLDQDVVPTVLGATTNRLDDATRQPSTGSSTPCRSGSPR